jgi:clan AA aspartic protease (TIGR02281 family)
MDKYGRDPAQQAAEGARPWEHWMGDDHNPNPLARGEPPSYHVTKRPQPAPAPAAPKPTVTLAPYFPQQTPIPINTDGHFHPVVRINGGQLTMLADTGASFVALTANDAQKIGINLQTLQFTGKLFTANGTMPLAPLLLQEVNIGGIILRNVRASCCVSGSESLLGMSVLGQLNIRIANGLMYLAPK